MAKIRTLDFLPEIFQTDTNAQFLGATLDQLVNPPVTEQLQGYVGSKFGYGINAKNNYVTEPTKTRTDYQLDPSVVFLKKNETVAKDFITYPGMLDALKLRNGVTEDNDRLFTSEIYSWDSFTDLDKLINFNQYYWIPNGPPVVTVASATVFSTSDYIVTDTPNAYNIKALGSATGTNNPTLTLLRGGSYRFAVNQETQFWIQGVPGVTGLDGNQNTRQVLGVSNNGATQGYVNFTVPNRDAQNDLLFPGNNLVDVVSTTLFSEINGKTLSEIGNIDGVTSLDNLTVMFYDTGEPTEVGFVQSFFDENGANYDVNLTTPELVAPVTLAITETTTNSVVTSGTTEDLIVNQTVTFEAIPASDPLLGGLDVNTIYYVKEIVDATSFKLSDTLNGPEIVLSAETGTMTANINEGLFEEGFYTNVSENFYTIQYVGTSDDPTIRLIPAGVIPTEEKITAVFGTDYIGLTFYRNEAGTILQIPYLSAVLDTLYYQDGTNANKVGAIRLIDSNLTNTLDVDEDIIGHKTFESTNGVVFTNGLKVQFDGDVIPTSYLSGEYYVEGVGESIQLIPTTDLIVPEDFTGTEFIPYDTLNYSIGNFDVELFIPIDEDYLTINRGAINNNAWSRSNRWFHIDVINASATYNNDPSISTVFATGTNKAKRPIVEFYPNLKLFDSGTVAKAPVDFIDTRTTNAFAQVANQQQYYPDIESYTNYTATIAPATAATTTTITIATTDIVAPFQVAQYVTDSTNLLPNNTTITAIEVSGLNTIITVSWEPNETFVGTSVASIVGSDTTVNNYELFSGARIVFTADTNPIVKDKIYVVGFSKTSVSSSLVITLSESEDSPVLVDNQTVSLRGFYNQGSTFWYDGTNWEEGQQKLKVNQAPLFDIFDNNGISFGDATIYQGTSFLGNKLFAYGQGAGQNDAVLGFPVRYSDIANLGDISFDVSLNVDTFNYVTGTSPVTQLVNTGYVYDYSARTTKTRKLGWQTAVAPSVQYQIFELEYTTGSTAEFTCDVSVIAEDYSNWPRVQVYVNNVYQLPTEYTLSSTDKTTTVTLNTAPLIDTPIQILLLSKQVSKTAYYSIPINLSNNPFNESLQEAALGDIRRQYQDTFINNANTTGVMFGANNYRDLGNMVPYGTSIIQNSASLVLPGTFLRKSEYNIFDALQYNSEQYVKYKQLIVQTVNNTEFEQRFNPSVILDTALETITQAKSEGDSFFWSDMLPSQSPFKSTSYTFANALSEAIYPLSKIYDFTKANYSSVLVYLTRTESGVTTTTQLTTGVDYTVSSTEPSLTVTLGLISEDIITIKEYNQTYGSFVPNTPTKLGTYPAFIPGVVLDPNYKVPTYMLKGHDGSYTSLYTLNYTPETGLTDFRDQALLEFETRIYNNLKLSTIVPIEAYEILPGFFRESSYSNPDWIKMYTPRFLSWAGQNRINYKDQQYTSSDEFSFNYYQSGNKLTNTPIDQGYWRGIYQYYYGSSQPNIAPWEMLGFAEKPAWWETQYGAAPYTSNNTVMWNDIEAGIIWNGSVALSVTVDQLKRPGLSKILPVDDQGELLSPLTAILGNYTQTTFKRDWKAGDNAPAEFSYRRSSSWPFDLMRLFALTKPAQFFNLAVDIDNYKYNTEFKQYLVNDRSHLIISDVDVYGSGTPKTSYLNWIVDFEKQQGIDSTKEITTVLANLDVRLVYRLAGYSDKTALKFFVEKGTPNSINSSLLIPDESYQVLLHDNQPVDQIIYSAVVVQQVANGWKVFGNSQSQAYFTIDQPIFNGNNSVITYDNLTVKVAKDYTTSATDEQLVPYGTQFYTPQELSQFLGSYGAWTRRKGMQFDYIDNAIEVNWELMVKEYIYWVSLDWSNGSLITLNPAAQYLKINKDSTIVQPLTISQNNFVLNQNFYPIAIQDMSISRLDTEFTIKTQNDGDTFAYGQFNLSNFEHGIVFDNTTNFNDVIYNLVTGLKQNRVFLRGTKSAEWNGTVFASGFIYNQDNVKEWETGVKYTRGMIVTFKNKYWTASKIIEPSATFRELDWVETDYDQIQTGLLPNSSTRAYEQTLYYNTNKANLERDADQLSFSLIGYRPRDYLGLIDLTDITQINVYKNMIKLKGTVNAVSAFKGANLPQGGIDYDVYENWGILSGQFGGSLNNNFVDFKLNEALLTGNPAITALTNGVGTPGSQQEIAIYNLYNYARPISSPDVLPTLTNSYTENLYPTAGYVNFNDVKMSSFYYSGLPRAVNQERIRVPIRDFYVRDYAWLANFKADWGVYAWKPIARVIGITSNTDNTTTITFDKPHGLTRLDPVSFINVARPVNGYYITTAIVSITQITINLNLPDANDLILTGNGLGLKFLNQRVKTPSAITDLDLNEAEFSKNTVWVDEAPSGDWGTYRKSINYAPLDTLSIEGAETFASAVMYTPRMGYLVGDQAAGKVYRYGYNTTTSAFDLDAGSTLTGAASFGTTIAYSGNLFAISEPTTTTGVLGSSTLRIYTLNDTVLSDDIIPLQEFIGPEGAGTSLAISDDQDWIYSGSPLSNQVKVYNRQRLPFTAGFFNIGETYEITSLGTTTDDQWKAIGAVEGKLGIKFNATGVGTGTGTADQISYVEMAEIEGTIPPINAVAGDNFGFSVSTDDNGDKIVVGAPNTGSGAGTDNSGASFVFNRVVQNFESQYNSIPNQPHQFDLAWTQVYVTRTATGVASNVISYTGPGTIADNDAIVFSENGTFGNSGINPNQVYYATATGLGVFSLKESRSTNTVVTLIDDPALSSSIWNQVDSTITKVSVNGTFVDDSNYAVGGGQQALRYFGNLVAGDIVKVDSKVIIWEQSFLSENDTRVGAQFGYALDTTANGSELLVGSPQEIIVEGQETFNGVVYRFTNAGGKYGVVSGTNECTLTANRTLLINGFRVNLTSGSNATAVANSITGAGITNITASATSDNKLIISVISSGLSLVNERIVLQQTDFDTLTELGIDSYVQTQIIKCPHNESRNGFGNTIKCNEYDSVVIAAPLGERFLGTTFDFTDDENLDNDTIFDNNATRFVDVYTNAGAVYMFDFLQNYQPSLLSPGKFIYAQNVNSKTENYGNQPLYGTALDFNSNQVVVGTPNFLPGDVNGQLTVYNNESGQRDWRIFRESGKVVDINKIQNTQIYSAETNNTLVNLDYLDPMQNNLLGAVRENLDYVSNIDPASYNVDPANVTSGLVWGNDHVGELWFDTTNTRWVNYHQDNDAQYNSRYWGATFPGSDVAVYTWVKSNQPPSQYTGLGTVKNATVYTIESKLNATNIVVPVYYFWVRNTNVIITDLDKTLSDGTLERYIKFPRSSGIAYMAPVLPNAFAIYNSDEFINANDSVFHVGFATGESDAVPHQEFNLIRDGFADDFLPGLPKLGVQNSSTTVPIGLYDRLLDSMSGVDESGQIVPDPYLPKAVQSGVLARPRQSFFFDRFLGIQNYLVYANTILAQFPIAETRQNATYLFQTGTYYDTTDYWEYVNWYLPTVNPVGQYNNNTKSTVSVEKYADLASLTVDIDTIATVEQNGDGKWELYRFDGNGVWTRIGLENGTIQFKTYLWDYAAGKTGFGDNFFDTDSFDEYPSEETRWIIRALNEQIYIDELITYRNKSLILLFEYIQSETDESQNFLPWLNKTSLVDVSHTIRELKPIQNFQSDNQNFLSGYLNEVKPYHVVIKDFLFNYTGEDIYQGTISDFDLPAEYNSNVDRYISPQLVYNNVNNENQYLPTNAIWQTPQYKDWFNNYGVSILGQTDYDITILSNYIEQGSTTLIVDNAQGFPINGSITIGTEEIAYSYVDRALNILGGLQRGINDTTATSHLPGAPIIIDLPAVLLLNGGKNYVEPPRVTAYIDTTIYPEPRVEAEFEVVMSLDSVNSVKVINPGEGYAVLPEIRIDSAVELFFTNSDINSTLHTISLFAPNLSTGDLIQYKDSEDGESVTLLENNQWYYINVLENTPTALIALYSSYGDAVNETKRIKFTSGTEDGSFSLNVGARASAITTSSPVRENIYTLKYDRTTYTSQIKDWEEGVFYGSFFAGSYFNSEDIASSAIKLQSTQPPIDSVAASAQGAVFEIDAVANKQTVEYSEFARRVIDTVATGNKIRLNPYDEASGELNASGSTIGFTVGMPIKFTGEVLGGIIADQVYFVKSIINTTDFTISETNGGTTFSVTTATASIPMIAYAGKVTDTAVLTLNYPGILDATATNGTTNKITIPQSIIGTGGTDGFYVGIPLFFTGTTFGNIVENDVYYVTTVASSSEITISSSTTPITTTVSATTTGTNIVTVEDSSKFTINDPIIFNTMLDSSGNVITDLGNIISGTVYYVNEIVSGVSIKIATQVNTSPLALTSVTGSALLTNQKDVLQLATATGSMTMNVSLPVSPGQVDGQKFTLYNTSPYYTNIASGTLTAQIARTVDATIATVDRVAMRKTDDGTSNFYVNMPVVFDDTVGGITTGTPYFVTDFSNLLRTAGTFIIGTTYTITSVGTTVFTDIGATSNNIGEVFVATGVGTGDGTATTTAITVFCTGTLTVDNSVTCVTTESMYDNMPIIFTGIGLGNIVVGTEYYVRDILDATSFTLSETISGAEFDLLTDNGSMTGTGSQYITISTSAGGANQVLSNSLTEFGFTQTPQSVAEFDIGYKLGGYRAIISSAGSGYAITNTITVSGAEVGGTSTPNDVTLIVDAIDDDGAITSLIISGDPADILSDYYLKIQNQNQLEVYSDPLMTVPVSGIGFEFGGFVTTNVTATDSGGATTGYLTVDDTSSFEINDPVVFMNINTAENIASKLTNEVTYYIVFIDGTGISVSATPGGTVIDSLTSGPVDFSMSKAGSYAFLPEPFYFNQSIIKYLDRVYRCVISNNDDEFVIGKWEELRSDNRILNALDRVEGYYKPTVNMPGLDLTQLFEGVSYPNAVYLGNSFAPEDQFTIDTQLQDEPFYPKNISSTGVVWNGNNYYASSNLGTYSGILTSLTGTTWSIKQLATSVLDLTDIILGGGVYVMSCTNTATPIFRSIDGVTWTTNSESLTIPAVQLQSVAYRNGFYVAVGDEIVQSNDSFVWTSRKTYDTVFDVTLNGVNSIDASGFSGFIAVGKGKKYDYSTGVTELIDTNIVAYTTQQNGESWSNGNSVTPNGWNAVASNGTTAIVVGENNVFYQSNNGGNWTGINELSVVSINQASDQLNVSMTSGLTDGDPVRVTDSFGNLIVDTTYYVKVISTSKVELYSDSGLTAIVTLVDAVIPLDSRLFLYDATSQTLNDVVYYNSIWMTVGDNGRVQTSSDGLRWTTRTSGVTEKLNSLNYNADDDIWIIVGDNNIILESLDSGVTWALSNAFTTAEPIYDVKGANFAFGYGPEELVPGYIKDNFAMTVVTRPGTLWDPTEYSHTGFNVVSRTLAPTSEFQVDYSFDLFVQYPIDLSIQIIDPATGLGTGLATSEYTIDWPTKMITLNTPLQFAPKEELRIDVYEVGNGNQLVKANTDTDPIRQIESTGFDDIYLNCNYSATYFEGSGLIRTGSNAIEVEATATEASSDRITCVSVEDFVVNDPISFQGVVFGGVAEETAYYVKSISTATNSITISATYNPTTGLAGPVLSLTDATGSMIVNIQTGTGTVWTDPIIYHNGSKLVLGKNNTVSRTRASNNAITTGSTVGLIANSRIYFAADMFGTDITPNSEYFIKTIVDGNEFTISETLGGTTLTLADASGQSSYVSNDYAISIQPNGTQAKLVFGPPNSYTNNTDYLVYSLFGESNGTTQYGYTVPEVQEFVGNGSSSSYALDNFVGGTNPHNAIVEINGLRQTISQYTIDDASDTILFNSPPANGAKISVLTYNDTGRQYLTTQYGIAGISGSSATTITVTATDHYEGTFDEDTPSIETYDQDAPTIVTYDELLDTLTCADTSVLTVDEPIVFSNPTIGGLTAGVTYYILTIIDATTFTVSTEIGGAPATVTTDSGSMVGSSNAVTVANITAIETSIEEPLVTTATATSSTGDLITFTDTSGFVPTQPILFAGTQMGNIVPGTYYFVGTVSSSTEATITDQFGAVITQTNASGNMLVKQGGNPTTRITTGIPHALVDDVLCTIDGTLGSVELNGNSYYAKVIDAYKFDIYTQVFNPAVDAPNNPVVGVSTYISGGYVWRQGTFFLSTTVASETVASNNSIVVDSTTDLVVNTPVIFTAQGSQVDDVLLGGIVQGTTYYVNEILSGTTFTIKTTRTGIASLSLTNETGVMNVTQWEQTNVERIWVTVNGLRIPNNKLVINSDNEVSILTVIQPGDIVIMTNMIPHSTPDEEIYLNFVNSDQKASIYRANVQARTWLTKPINDLTTSIYVYDVTRLTDNVIQTNTTTAPSNNLYSIGLVSDKRILTGVTVVNTTTGATLDPETDYFVTIEDLAPILNIRTGTYITTGDELKITSLVGNQIYVNGEQIGFTSVDFATNSISGLQRGTGGTGKQNDIPVNTEVLGLLNTNRLPNVYYDQTWNSYNFNAVQGDPLQISDTVSAQFLHTDIT